MCNVVGDASVMEKNQAERSGRDGQAIVSRMNRGVWLAVTCKQCHEGGVAVSHVFIWRRDISG